MSNPDRYPRSPSPLRPTFAILFVAGAFCALTIFVLPFFGALSARVHETTEIRLAPEVAYVPPPPDPLVPPVPDRPEPPRDRPTAPDMGEARAESVAPAPTPRIPIQSLPTAALDANAVAVDTSFDFEVLAPPAGAGEAPQGRGVRATEPDSLPVPILRTEPIYPERARRRKTSGWVELRLRIDREGQVVDIEVLDSRPGTTFVRSARRAVKRWRFRPAMRNGRPISAWVRQTIKFEMTR